MYKKILETKLVLKLRTTADPDDNAYRAQGEIDFNSKKGKKLISLDPDDVDAERIHWGAVDLEATEQPVEECAFKEYMQFGGSKSSFNVQYMDCWKKYQPMTFPLCFKLNPGGTISPTQSECYQGGNPFVQEYLTGSWSCNAINISFKTTMNGFMQDPGIACHVGCMAVTAALSGTATITADKDGNLINTATGDVTQSYSWDHACCPTTKPPESDVCGGSF
jgi:hypothetical protein